MRRVAPASVLLRLLGFTVPAVLALAGLQPLIGAAAGSVHESWGIGLGLPTMVGAAAIFASSRLLDSGDAVQPPWYSAWMLLPGAFLLAGSAAMCIFGALVELPLIAPAMWLLLITGALSWSGALVLVRRASR